MDKTFNPDSCKEQGGGPGGMSETKEGVVGERETGSKKGVQARVESRQARLDNLPSSLRATSWQPEASSPRRSGTETTGVNLCENLSSCLW